MPDSAPPSDTDSSRDSEPGTRYEPIKAGHPKSITKPQPPSSSLSQAKSSGGGQTFSGQRLAAWRKVRAMCSTVVDNRVTLNDLEEELKSLAKLSISKRSRVTEKMNRLKSENVDKLERASRTSSKYLPSVDLFSESREFWEVLAHEIAAYPGYPEKPTTAVASAKLSIAKDNERNWPTSDSGRELVKCEETIFKWYFDNHDRKGALSGSDITEAKAGQRRLEWDRDSLGARARLHDKVYEMLNPSQDTNPTSIHSASARLGGSLAEGGSLATLSLTEDAEGNPSDAESKPKGKQAIYKLDRE